MHNSSFRITAVAVLVALMTTSAEARGCWGSSCSIRHNPRYDSYWPRRIMHRRLNTASPLETFLSDVFPNLYNGNTLLRQSQRSAADQQQQREQEEPEEEERSASTTTTTTASPRYDIAETENSYELIMELPGVSANDLTVEVEDNSVLRIQGSRSGFGLVETVTFEQSFTLQDIDTERIIVTLSNGLLNITAPKREHEVVRLDIANMIKQTEKQTEKSSSVTRAVLRNMSREELGIEDEKVLGVKESSARQREAGLSSSKDAEL